MTTPAELPLMSAEEFAEKMRGLLDLAEAETRLGAAFRTAAVLDRQAPLDAAYRAALSEVERLRGQTEGCYDDMSALRAMHYQEISALSREVEALRRERNAGVLLVGAAASGVGDKCARCGGDFDSMENRFYLSAPADWAVRTGQGFGPLHTKCSMWYAPKAQAAVDKILSRGAVRGDAAVREAVDTQSSSPSVTSGDASESGVATSSVQPPREEAPSEYIESHYWCGCRKSVRWERCEDDAHLESDDEPPAQYEVPERSAKYATWLKEQGK